MDKNLTVLPTEGLVSMVDWLQEQGIQLVQNELEGCLN